jgi:Asp-tRNA(Asn)/Glu-tRNA(Gln) amidotransferase A subunit family amidase
LRRRRRPVGIRLVAPPDAEAALLRAAHAYEQATPWHAMRPNLSFGFA